MNSFIDGNRITPDFNNLQNNFDIYDEISKKDLIIKRQ